MTDEGAGDWGRGVYAKNLIVRLGELETFEVVKFSRQTPEKNLPALVADIDAVVHLAGVNRPLSPDELPRVTRALQRACARPLSVVDAKCR